MTTSVQTSPVRSGHAIAAFCCREQVNGVGGISVQVMMGCDGQVMTRMNEKWGRTIKLRREENSSLQSACRSKLKRREKEKRDEKRRVERWYVKMTVMTLSYWSNWGDLWWQFIKGHLMIHDDCRWIARCCLRTDAHVASLVVFPSLSPLCSFLHVHNRFFFLPGSCFHVSPPHQVICEKIFRPWFSPTLLGAKAGLPLQVGQL